jgi:capsular polysaccharide biosynthesis protein
MITRGIVKSLSSGVNPFKRRGKPDQYDYNRLGLLTGPLSEAYAHWFHDYLTRLEGLEHYIEVTGNRPPLLVQSDPPFWMSKSLQYLGYTSGDLVEWDEPIGRVKELVIPSVRANCVMEGQKDPRQMHRTGYSYRKRLIEKCQDPENDTSSPNIIFINRKDAPTRRVLNRESVLSELTEYNITSVAMSNLPFQKQVFLMKGTDVIVAPHGAGLLNMLWATDAAIVEIFGSHATAGNMSLANNIGHQYFCVNATAEGRDIRVDPKIVRNTVDQAMTSL